MNKQLKAATSIFALAAIAGATFAVASIWTSGSLTTSEQLALTGLCVIALGLIVAGAAYAASDEE